MQYIDLLQIPFCYLWSAHLLSLTLLSLLFIVTVVLLTMDIPPGTKFRLMGSIPISMGFLLLSKNHLKVLGGTVTNLIREWNMTKYLSSHPTYLTPHRSMTYHKNFRQLYSVISDWWVYSTNFLVFVIFFSNY
ncbi:unnamed protein product [Trichobilharzia regenti]|nr:unnamed protein product [Trichobilharzia regenti]